MLFWSLRHQTLQSMGITAAFSDKAADFSRVSEDPLFVTSVMQSVRTLLACTAVAVHPDDAVLFGRFPQ